MIFSGHYILQNLFNLASLTPIGHLYIHGLVGGLGDWLQNQQLKMQVRTMIMNRWKQLKQLFTSSLAELTSLFLYSIKGKNRYNDYK